MFGTEEISFLKRSNKYKEMKMSKQKTMGYRNREKNIVQTFLVQILLFYFGTIINVSWQHCQWHFCVQHKDKNIPFFVERQICYVGLCSFHIKKAKDPTHILSYNKIKPSTSCIKEFFCRKGDQKT